MRNLITTIVAFMLLAWAGTTLAGVTPEQRCEGGKNQAAGKYASCRQSAEKGLVLTGDADRYNAALAKCDSKLSTAWQKEDARATAAGAVCPDVPLVEADFKAAIDAHAGIIATALGGGGLIDCPSDLATCSGDLGTCNGSLGTCNASYASCSSSLSTCNTSYSSCTTSLATCAAGTATSADVLVGKTFSSSAGVGATGIMPNNGAVSITPGTTPQTIAAGYHNGTGSVAGDADLIASNIRLGVSVFGFAGTLGCGNGVIDAGEQCDQASLNGATCVTQGFASGTLQCGAGCLLDTGGCYSVRFTDNGDGTITDAQTGLMWEKKGDLDAVPVVCTSSAVCPNPHDADNEYTYSSGSPLGPPGTAYTVLLAQLNAGGGFAGHTDWRLPTREELMSIADYADASAPVVPAQFDASCTASCVSPVCSCTAAGLYWTNDLVASISGNAWLLNFGDGSVLTDTRDTTYNVRAVR